MQGRKSVASRDDAQIIDEIEKTIQGLLNLNILESSSTTSDNDDPKPTSPGDSDACPEANQGVPAARRNALETSGSDGKSSNESFSKPGDSSGLGDSSRFPKAAQCHQMEK